MGSAPLARLPWDGRFGLLISFARFLIGWKAFLLLCFESSSYSLAESFAGHPACRCVSQSGAGFSVLSRASHRAGF